METVELLKTLSDAFGPSGFEEEVCEVLQRLIEPYVDEMRVDTLGNLIATRRGTGDTTLMLDAHMDEIGFIVTYVEDGGFLRFARRAAGTHGSFPPMPSRSAATTGRRSRATSACRRRIFSGPKTARNRTSSRTCSSISAQQC